MRVRRLFFVVRLGPPGRNYHRSIMPWKGNEKEDLLVLRCLGPLAEAIIGLSCLGKATKRKVSSLCVAASQLPAPASCQPREENRK